MSVMSRAAGHPQAMVSTVPATIMVRAKPIKRAHIIPVTIFLFIK
jgi:hypothetical protein